MNAHQIASQFNTDRTHPGRWTINFSNPPINMFVPTTIVELGALMSDLEADPSVKVVVFQSANPDFFIAHLDVSKAAERPGVLDLWRDFVLRLSSTPIVSIAKIRGRTRGIGNEFVLACDMRFASRQSALFGNPEIGVGLVPGGGAGLAQCAGAPRQGPRHRLRGSERFRIELRPVPPCARAGGRR
jgi:enoyl-CoA hydratase/carnithine racemase